MWWKKGSEVDKEGEKWFIYEYFEILPPVTPYGFATVIIKTAKATDEAAFTEWYQENKRL